MESWNVLGQWVGELSSWCWMLQENQAGFENHLILHLLLDSSCLGSLLSKKCGGGRASCMAILKKCVSEKLVCLKREM